MPCFQLFSLTLFSYKPNINMTMNAPPIGYMRYPAEWIFSHSLTMKMKYSPGDAIHCI